MSEFLRNIATPSTGADSEHERQLKENAVYSVATRIDSSEYFNSIMSNPGEGAVVSKYMRQKANKAEVQEVLADPHMDNDERLAELERIALGYEKTPREMDLELQSGIESNAVEALGLYVSPKKVAERKRQNIESLRQAMDSALVETFRDDDGNLKVDSFLGRVRVMAEAVEWALLGQNTNELFHVFKKFVPDLDPNRFTSFSEGMQAFVDHIVSLPADEAASVSKAAIKDLRERSGFILDNDVAFHQSLKEIEANLDGEEPLPDWLTGIFAVLEASAVVPAVVFKAPKVVAGSLAKSLGKGRGGATNLVRQASKGEDSEKLLDALGADSADVMGEHVVPKMVGDGFDAGAHYIDVDLVDPAKAWAMKVEKGRDIADFVGTIRSNTTVFEDTADGFDAVVSLGRGKDGLPFQTEAAAKVYQRNLDMMDNTQVVSNPDGGFFVQYRESFRYGADMLPGVQPGVTVSGGRWRSIFGRNAQFVGAIQRLAHQSFVQGAKERAIGREILKPYTSLPTKKQATINLELMESEGKVAWKDRKDLHALGWDDQMINGYNAVRRSAERALAVKNVRVRGQMIDQGYRSLTLGDTPLILKPMDDAGGATHVLDEAGNLIPRPSSEDFFFWRVRGVETVDGVKNNVMAVSKNRVLDLPPRQVIKPLDKVYLGRSYQKPVFVQKVSNITKNGVKVDETETIYTASSAKRASEVVKSLSDGADEGTSYTWKRADELTGAAANRDVIDEIVDEGLLVGSKRKWNAVDDVDGAYKPPSVYELIGKMQHASSTNAGMGRYVDRVLDSVKKEYPELGITGLGKMPDNPGGPGEARWKEATQVLSHLRNLSGIGVGQMDQGFRSFRNSFADIFYNRGLSTLGDEVSGLSTVVTDTMKSVGFRAYLLLNPARQAILQATMVPTYAGVQGGLTYAPKAFGELTAWATGVGRSKELEGIIEQFNKSGLREAIDEHILDIGRAAEAGIKHPGAVANSMNLVKKIGMDVGVGIDKRGAFLFSHNRFKTIHGRAPKNSREWKEVGAFAEQMALNQNRSDTLLTQNGVLSLLTQFMSHQFKMTGRLLMLEKDFTVAERARMSAMAAISYGAAGLGLHEVYEEIKTRLGVDPPPAVDRLINQGLVGEAASLMLNVGSMSDEDYVAMNSGSLSPINFIGDYVSAVSTLVEGMAGGGFELDISIPAISLLGDLGDAVAFSADMLGVAATSDSFDVVDAVKASVPEYLKILPLTNNIRKAQALIETGKVVDSRGRPIMEGNGAGSLIATILGIKHQGEEDLHQVMTRVYGEYQGVDEDGEGEAVDADAKKAAKIAWAIIDRTFGGDRNATESREIMKHLWAGARATMSKPAFGRFSRTYYREINKLAERAGTTLSDRLTGMYMENFAQGRVKDERRTVDWIRMQEFDGARELADQLEMRLYGSE